MDYIVHSKHGGGCTTAGAHQSRLFVNIVTWETAACQEEGWIPLKKRQDVSFPLDINISYSVALFGGRLTDCVSTKPYLVCLAQYCYCSQEKVNLSTSYSAFDDKYIQLLSTITPGFYCLRSVNPYSSYFTWLENGPMNISSHFSRHV